MIDKTIGPGDRIEIIGGFLDGLRGTMITSNSPVDLTLGTGRLIYLKGDDNKGYPVPKDSFRELRLLEDGS
jgi:hypothetical protein